MQGRGKLHKAILQHVLAGSLADVTKAALVAVHAALASLGQQASAAAGAAAPAARSREQQQQQQRDWLRQQEGPGIVLVLGSSMAVHLPAGFVAGHGGGMAAAGAAAAAVQHALRSLRIGRTQLAVPLAAACSAGPSLHPLARQPVLVPAAQAVAGCAGPAQQQQYAGAG